MGCKPTKSLRFLNAYSFSVPWNNAMLQKAWKESYNLINFGNLLDPDFDNSGLM